MKSLRLQPYDEHEINKYANVEHRFVCFICIEICYSIEKLKLHYINVHGYKSPAEESDFSKLNNKGKEITTENKTSYYSSKICSVCSVSFKNSKTLSKHVKVVHNKLKSFICNVCSKQMSRKASLDIHLRQHLSDESAKFKLPCPHPGCNFKAADPSVMSKHRKLHQKSNDGKYKCLAEHCEYYAIQATGLKNHVLSKHPSLYAATMKCAYVNCEFVSVNPERLRRHVLAHEKGLLDAKEEVHVAEDPTKTNLNTSMEISSDCFLPIESTDSIVNHSVDTGGVTIIHIQHSTSSSTNVHSEDTVF